MDDTLIEDFINEVRSHEMLYDKANKNYTKNNLKNKKWIDIGKQFAITGDEAKTQFKSLRDKFRREKVLSENARSGDGADDDYNRSWIHYGSLTFLLPCMKSRTYHENVFKNKEVVPDDELFPAEQYGSEEHLDGEEFTEQDHFDDTEYGEAEYLESQQDLEDSPFFASPASNFTTAKSTTKSSTHTRGRGSLSTLQNQNPKTTQKKNYDEQDLENSLLFDSSPDFTPRRSTTENNTHTRGRVSFSTPQNQNPKTTQKKSNRSSQNASQITTPDRLLTQGSSNKSGRFRTISSTAKSNDEALNDQSDDILKGCLSMLEDNKKPIHEIQLFCSALSAQLIRCNLSNSNVARIFQIIQTNVSEFIIKVSNE